MVPYSLRHLDIHLRFKFVGKLLAEFGHFGANEIRAIGLRGILLKILLVILFPHVEWCGRDDFRHNGFLEEFFARERGDDLVGHRLLLR